MFTLQGLGRTHRRVCMNRQEPEYLRLHYTYTRGGPWRQLLLILLQWRWWLGKQQPAAASLKVLTPTAKHKLKVVSKVLFIQFCVTILTLSVLIDNLLFPCFYEFHQCTLSAIKWYHLFYNNFCKYESILIIPSLTNTLRNELQKKLE